MMMLKNLAAWLHVLCMVATLGAAAFAQFGLSGEQRSEPRLAGRFNRLTHGLLGLGLLAGLAAYFLMIKISGGGLPKGYHHSVGTKFVLFLAVGGCLGAASAVQRKGKDDKASVLRWVAVGLLAVAALLGVTARP